MEVTAKKLSTNVGGLSSGAGVSGAGAGTGDPGGSSASHTTSSGREVILSWKIRSQHAKQPVLPSNQPTTEKISPPGKS